MDEADGESKGARAATLRSLPGELGYEASLEVRKRYAVLDDSSADADNLIRVIDASGEDYLYPARLLQKVELPAGLQRKLRPAS